MVHNWPSTPPSCPHCAETVQHEEELQTTAVQALQEARRRKERTYPELAGDAGRARLVVLAAEAGSRWSEETAQFLRGLAKARADSVPPLLQGRVKAAWLRRWSSACMQCDWSFRGVSPGDSPVPRIGAVPSTYEVLRDAFL